MKKPILKFSSRAENYENLARLGYQVKAFLTENVGLYPTPNPTVVQLTTHLTALDANIGAWGPKQVRGSMADLVALKLAATNVGNDLLLLAAYVANTVDNTQPNQVQRADLLESGFPTANLPSKIPLLCPVQKLHTPARKNVVEPNVLVAWKKPQQLLTGSRVKVYNIYKNGTFVKTVTKTSLIVVRSAGATPDVYTIKPVGELGEGAGVSVTINSQGA